MAFNLDNLLSTSNADISPDGTTARPDFNGEITNFGNGYRQSVQQGINNTTDVLNITLTPLSGTAFDNVFNELKKYTGDEVEFTDRTGSVSSSRTSWLLRPPRVDRYYANGLREISFTLVELHKNTG